MWPLNCASSLSLIQRWDGRKSLELCLEMGNWTDFSAGERERIEQTIFKREIIGQYYTDTSLIGLEKERKKKILYRSNRAASFVGALFWDILYPIKDSHGASQIMVQLLSTTCCIWPKEGLAILLLSSWKPFSIPTESDLLSLNVNVCGRGWIGISFLCKLVWI